MDSIIEILQQVPAAAWSAIVAAVLTSGIAFLGVSYTNRENRKRMLAQHDHERSLRKDEIIRERAEELYVIVKKWCSTMISDHFPYVRVMKGQFSYNDALDMTLASGDKRKYDPDRMHMICDIYFPDLSKEIDALLKMNCELLDFRDMFKKKYESGKLKDEKMAEAYLEKIKVLIEEARKLEHRVADAVKSV
ncbi:hypothetical protein [Plesiomonas shigelloides]|uniref:hypothetical protein n=1 Tax=Plesiomonas shigelloides TaxID=703 RepID=UPI00387F0D3B